MEHNASWINSPVKDLNDVELFSRVLKYLVVPFFTAHSSKTSFHPVCTKKPCRSGRVLKKPIASCLVPCAFRFPSCDDRHAQRIVTGYCRMSGSDEASVSPCACAWQTSIRSKGSRCNAGSASNCTTAASSRASGVRRCFSRCNGMNCAGDCGR